MKRLCITLLLASSILRAADPSLKIPIAYGFTITHKRPAPPTIPEVAAFAFHILHSARPELTQESLENVIRYNRAAANPENLKQLLTVFQKIKATNQPFSTWLAQQSIEKLPSTGPFKGIRLPLSVPLLKQFNIISKNEYHQFLLQQGFASFKESAKPDENGLVYRNYIVHLESGSYFNTNPQYLETCAKQEGMSVENFLEFVKDPHIQYIAYIPAGSGADHELAALVEAGQSEAMQTSV